MIQVSLQLRAAPDAVRPACAYFLAGDDAAAWIATIARWNVPMSSLRLYVIPRCLADQTAIGALVIGKELPHDSESPSCLPYGKIHGKLYLPVDSILWPPATDEEIGRLLPGHLYVMHPSAGLVGFEQADGLTVQQLLVPPPFRPETFDRAVPGVAGASRLRSVTAPPLPAMEDMLDQGREDIGDDSPRGIPKLPDDPAGSAAGRVAGKALLGAIGILGALGAGLGGMIGSGAGAGRAGGRKAAGGSGGGRGGALGDWFNRKFAALSRQMLAARHKEISRLMRLMETDPDLGLRYALPLSGLAGRGRAAPGAQLGLRSTQFNLGMLRGGQAADQWDLPYEYQVKLTQQYRQAANREMSLGRFRRAAYIFAVLLSDYHSAANALRQGKCFREAAALYKDRLHNPAEAAKCLEAGGLLLEAIPLYEGLEQFEKAGDLYAVLGKLPEAEADYRKAVKSALGGGKRIAAAGILERKLKAPDEAVELLAAGWPNEPQAAECLKAQINLLGRLGRHDQSRHLLGRLRAQTPPRHRLPLIGALAEASRAYPDQPTRQVMCDTTRVVSSAALAEATPSDASVVTHALVRLCPEDRLLARDAQRYSTRHAAQWRPKAPVPPPAAGRKQVALLRTVPLPENCQWSRFASAGGFLYAAGFDTHGLVPCVLLHNWIDEHRLLRLRQIYRRQEPLLMAASRREHQVFLTSLHGRRLTQREVPVGGGGILRGGVPDWAPDGVAGVTYDNLAQAWMLVVVNDQLQLSCYSPQGQLLRSQLLSMMPLEAVPSIPLMLVRGDDLYFAVNDWLFWCNRDGQVVQEQMPSPILSLSATIPHSVIRLAVTLQEGGRLVSTGQLWPQCLPFGEGMADPVATLTNDGHLIAAAKGAGRIYNLNQAQLKHLADFEAPQETPLAVLSTGSAGEFAVATSTAVSIYKSR